MKNLLAAFVLLTGITACAPSPGMIQTAIAQTQAVYTPTPEPTPASTVEVWRIEPYPEGTEMRYDTFTDMYPVLETFLGKREKDLGLTKPYRWEEYLLPKTVQFKDIEFHYTRILRNRGYAKEWNDYNSSGRVGVLAFTTVKQTIYIEAWENLNDEGGLVFVAYKDVQ